MWNARARRFEAEAIAARETHDPVGGHDDVENTARQSGEEKHRAPAAVFEYVQKKCRKDFMLAYHASYAAPLALMGWMNSSSFRNMWQDSNFESRPAAVVTALDNDLDGMRAYFCGRAWFPVRLPIFLMGMILGDMRIRLARRGVDHTIERFWIRYTDYFSCGITIWLICCIVCSGLVADSKNIRIFNEFFLTAPCAFWLYGLTIASKSVTVRALRNPVLQNIGTWSFAMYLLQFPLFTSWAAFEYDTMRVFPACDRSSPDVKVWADCFHNFESDNVPPNVVVIAFLFFLVLVSFIAHNVVEKPANKYIQRLLSRRQPPSI
jgi:hypothetical protein